MRSEGSRSTNTNKPIITGLSLDAKLDVLFNWDTSLFAALEKVIHPFISSRLDCGDACVVLAGEISTYYS